MKQTCMMLILFLVNLPGFSQHTVAGTVKDEKREPLPGAHVILSRDYYAGLSGNDGRFAFTKVKTGTYVLRVSFVGYQTLTREIFVDSDLELDLVMERAMLMADEVVVKAIRAGARDPVSYTDLSREQIERRNHGTDMPYLLGLTPSLVHSSDAGTGIGYTSLRIRGADANRINVTINGVPLNDAESHGVWWINLPDFASSVENIQIQRGVGTSSNGAGAFGATINLQTTSLKPEPYGEIISSAGSFKTFRNTLSLGSGLINERFSFDARMSKISSDGFIDRAFADLKSFFVSGAYHGEKNLLKVNIFSGKQVTYQAWDGVPSSLLGENRTYNGIGSYTNAEGETVYYENETDNYQQDHYHILYSHEMSPSLNLNASLHYTRGYGYYEQYKENQKFSNYGLENLVIGTETITRTNLIRRKILDNHFYGLTYSLVYRKDKTDLSMGGAANHYLGDHYGNIIRAEFAAGVPENHKWYLNSGDKVDANVFGKLNVHILPKLYVYGDLQYRFIRYRIEGIHDDLRDISQEHGYHFFNPKAGLFFEPNERHSLFLSYSIANREPNRSNFRDAKTDELPRPERLGDLEAGYHLKTQGFRMGANLYYMNYRDQLVLTGEINDVGAAMMTNVPESYRLGVEWMAALKLIPRVEISTNLTLSDNRIKNFTAYVDNWDYWDDPENEPLQVSSPLGKTHLAFSPPVVAGMQVSWMPADRFEMSLRGKYVGKQFIDNTSSENRRLDPYFFSDLLLEYSLSNAWFREMKIHLLVNNLFNAKYETNAWIYRYIYQGEENYMDGYFPQAGAHFLAGVQWRF